MKVAIVGSRDLPLSARTVIRDLVRSLPEGTTVISGEAPGADRWAKDAAMERGLPYHPYPAAWQGPDGVTDKKAGYKRNRRVGDDCDILCCIWSEMSGGSAHTSLYTAIRAKKTYVWTARGWNKVLALPIYFPCAEGNWA